MKIGLIRLALITSSLAGLFGFFTLIVNHESQILQPKPSECIFLGLKPPADPSEKSTLILKKGFLSFLSSSPQSFEKKPFGLVLPLFLTKDQKWLVSYKSFLFTPQGRAEIAHLPLNKIQKLFGRPLLLDDVLKLFPKKILFLRISTRDPEKIFKNLKFLYPRKNTFISSSNEELIQALLRDKTSFSLVHSSRSLVRFQFMNLFGLSNLFFLPAPGIIIPVDFSISEKTVLHLKAQGKHLFLETKNPLQDIPSYLSPFLSGILSENRDQGIQFVKNKKPCLKKL